MSEFYTILGIYLELEIPFTEREGTAWRWRYQQSAYTKTALPPGQLPLSMSHEPYVQFDHIAPSGVPSTDFLAATSNGAEEKAPHT